MNMQKCWGRLSSIGKLCTGLGRDMKHWLRQKTSFSNFPGQQPFLLSCRNHKCRPALILYPIRLQLRKIRARHVNMNNSKGQSHYVIINRPYTIISAGYLALIMLQFCVLLDSPSVM